jgi:hypothetical protein
MIFRFLLAALPALGASLPVFDEEVEVQAGQWRPFHLEIERSPATVEFQFGVTDGLSGVRVDLVRESDLDRNPPGSAASTSFVREGARRVRLREAGRYYLIVDNTFEHRAPARIRLKVRVNYNAAVEVRTVPESRRRAVVVLSLLVFGVISGWSAQRILAALRRRNSGLPPPFA